MNGFMALPNLIALVLLNYSKFSKNCKKEIILSNLNIDEINKDLFYILLKRRLANEKEKVAAERAAERKSLVSTGDRSAKIRTYNFPQGRVTDHRINFTSYRLSEIINGDVDELIEKLKIAEQQDILSSNI